MTRAGLEKDDEFQLLFKRAKERVGKMQVRFVEVSDHIVQTLTEVAASIELNTLTTGKNSNSGGYNDFGTH